LTPRPRLRPLSLDIIRYTKHGAEIMTIHFGGKDMMGWQLYKIHLV
jgi:hypothetical protein